MEGHSEEEDDVKLSFHGALAHFAYAPSPPPFPLPPPPSLSTTHYAATATAPDAVARSQNNWAQSSDARNVHDRSSNANNSSGVHGSSEARYQVPASRKHSNSERKGGGGDRLRTGSRSPKKRRKMGYTAPDAYAHLKGLPDCVAQDLDGTPNTMHSPTRVRINNQTPFLLTQS